MRILLLFIFFTYFLNADYLYNNNTCVSSFKSINKNRPNRKQCRIFYSAGGRVNLRPQCLDLNLINGYTYDANLATCSLDNDWSKVGLSEEDWNFQIAIVANLTGFTIYFLVNFLSILVMRR